MLVAGVPLRNTKQTNGQTDVKLHVCVCVTVYARDVDSLAEDGRHEARLVYRRRDKVLGGWGDSFPCQY